MNQTVKVTVHYRSFGDVQDFDIEMPFSENILEDVFAALNRGSGREIDALNGRRSLSVGDLLTVVASNGHETTWVCASLGWEKFDGDLATYNPRLI